MKARNTELVEDVQTLLEKTVLEEATVAVWSVFERALGTLDGESLQLLRRHFDGVPITQLADEHGLTNSQIEEWLKKVKRDLSEALRRDSKVRQ